MHHTSQLFWFRLAQLDSRLLLSPPLKTMPPLPMSSHLSIQSKTNSVQFYKRPLPSNCVSFSSTEGRKLFSEALQSGHMEAYFGLASQLCTQSEPAYCGLATLVMILNAFELDPGRVWKQPWRWYDESMLLCCLPPDTRHTGIDMDQFIDLAKCHGLQVEATRVSPDQATSVSSKSRFRHLLLSMTSSTADGYLAVNYGRRALNQTGDGHFAPIGGFHPQRDLVFLLDTARFKYPPHWAPLDQLWRGMCQLDTDQRLATTRKRGYVRLTKANRAESLRSSIHRPICWSDCTYPSGASPSAQLCLFDIDRIAQQAYQSSSCRHHIDTDSAANRLYQAIDQWVDWLVQTPTSTSNLLVDTLTSLVDAFRQHQPGACLISIGQGDSSSLDADDRQLQIIRDLFASPIGRCVTQFLASSSSSSINSSGGGNTLLSHYFLTSQSVLQRPPPPTRSTIDPPCQAITNAVSLFYTELSLHLVLTGLLSAFPYRRFVDDRSMSGGGGETRISQLIRLVEVDQQNRLLPASKSELATLHNLLCSLLATAAASSESKCSALINRATQR